MSVLIGEAIKKAIDPKTKKIIWKHSEEEYLDSRGLCMKDGRIYYYSPDNVMFRSIKKVEAFLAETSKEEETD